MRGMVITLAVLGCVGCSGRKNASPSRPPTAAIDEARTGSSTTAATIRAAEQAAAQRNAHRAECKDRVTIYDGSIDVDARNYLQFVLRGDAGVEEAVPSLDQVISTAPRIDFTLDYPFEKPFSGSITGEITLRRIIDAVRSGFRHMYEGATQRDIPNMYNKDVTGPYGRAFHAIGDLVIERIDLCDARWLDISIGS